MSDRAPRRGDELAIPDNGHMQFSRAEMDLKLAHKWCNSRRGSWPVVNFWTAVANDHAAVILSALRDAGVIDNCAKKKRQKRSA